MYGKKTIISDLGQNMQNFKEFLEKKNLIRIKDITPRNFFL